MNQNLPKLILVGVGIAAVIMAIVLALKPATTATSAIPVVEPDPPPQQLPSQIDQQFEPISVEAPEDMGDSDSETMAVYVDPSKVEEPCKQIIINDNVCISKAKVAYKKAYKNCNPESTISDSADIDGSSNVNIHTLVCTNNANVKHEVNMQKCSTIKVVHTIHYKCRAK